MRSARGQVYGVTGERRNVLESQTLSLSLRRHSVTHSFDIVNSLDFYARFLLITLGSVSQFLFTAKRLKLKSVSRFLFLDF